MSNLATTPSFSGNKVLKKIQEFTETNHVEKFMLNNAHSIIIIISVVTKLMADRNCKSCHISGSTGFYGKLHVNFCRYSRLLHVSTLILTSRAVVLEIRMGQTDRQTDRHTQLTRYIGMAMSEFRHMTTSFL